MGNRRRRSFAATSIAIAIENAKTINFLLSGISLEDISSFTENAVYLSSSTDDVYIELLSDEAFVIKFKDNLGINNIINFEAIK